MDVLVWLRSLGLGKYEAAFDHLFGVPGTSQRGQQTSSRFVSRIWLEPMPKLVRSMKLGAVGEAMTTMETGQEKMVRG